jgi:hypothetical protein
MTKSRATGMLKVLNDLSFGMRFPARIWIGALQQYGVELSSQQKCSRGRERARPLLAPTALEDRGSIGAKKNTLAMKTFYIPTRNRNGGAA